jgi:hypothetical protein
MASIKMMAETKEDALQFAADALEFIVQNNLDIRVGVGVGPNEGTVTLEGSEDDLSRLQVQDTRA